jgi:hypothetical protein
MENKSLETSLLSLAEEIKRGNDLTAELIRLQRNWRLVFWRGMLAGLGGVIGATLLVSVLLWALQPFKRLEVFKPTLDRIAQELERKPARWPVHESAAGAYRSRPSGVHP